MFPVLPLLVLLLQCRCTIALARLTSGNYLGRPAAGDPLRVTTLFGRNGRTVLECWQLPSSFAIGQDSGIEGNLLTTLGPVTSANLAIIKPGHNGGLHRAPRVQFVIWTSGLAKVTIPDSKDVAWMEGGGNGLLLAADTKDVVEDDGHITTYPSREQTVAFALPLPDDKPPVPISYEAGPCEWHKKRRRAYST
ncbi:MAG: hypothetical protein M1815_004616 [Lichina confinis]|nr:MAG: hypothetical protein M1815_004616 [Lichina confinis]